MARRFSGIGVVALMAVLTIPLAGIQPGLGPQISPWEDSERRVALDANPVHRAEDPERIIVLDAYALKAALGTGSLAILPFYAGERTLDVARVEIYAAGATLRSGTGGEHSDSDLESGSYGGNFDGPDGEYGTASVTVHPPFLEAFLRSASRVEWIRTILVNGIPEYYAGERVVSTDPAFVSERRGGIETLSHGTFSCGDLPKDVEQIVPHADYDYYTLKGSDLLAVQAAIEADMNRITNDVYELEVCIEFQILGIEVHTDASTEVLTSTDAATLINQFVTHFQNIHDASYNFDVSHLWTGKNLNGGTIGIANALGGRYSLSQQVTEGSYNAGNSFDRLILESHEIGHSYRGEHADAAVHCYWTTCYQTVMWTPFRQYNLFAQFSDTNVNQIRAESPKQNV